MDKKCYNLGFAVTPMSCFQNGIAPELWPKHPLEHLQHVPHGRGHPVVRLLEHDDEHVEISEVVLESLDHGVDMVPLISTKTTFNAVSVETVTYTMLSPKPGVSITVNLG